MQSLIFLEIKMPWKTIRREILLAAIAAGVAWYTTKKLDAWAQKQR